MLYFLNRMLNGSAFFFLLEQFTLIDLKRLSFEYTLHMFVSYCLTKEYDVLSKL